MTVKISELGSATLPLDGTELLEAVQSGSNVKITIDDIPGGGGLFTIDGTTITVAGDIVCNDLTTAGSSVIIGTLTLTDNGAGDLLVSGGVRANTFDVNYFGPLFLGELDGNNGSITMYSESSQTGASLTIHVPPAYDTTITTYSLRAQEDDLEIGPSTDLDALKYDGGTNSWQVQASGGLYVGDQVTASGSNIFVGINDYAGGNRGSIYLYSGNSTDGGRVLFHTGTPYDTTIDNYIIQANEDDLILGPNTDFDALKYDGGTNQWISSASGGMVVTGSSSGILRVGEDDSIVGNVIIYGNATDSGAALYVYNAGNYDTTIDYYSLQTLDDDLILGPSTNNDALKYDGAANAWMAQGTGGFYIGDRANANGSNLYIGVSDNSFGISARIYLYAGNSIDGGTVIFYTGAGYDTLIDNYYIRAYEDDLQIGPNTDTDAFKYDGGTNSWQAQATGGFYIGDRTNGNGSTLNIGVNDNTFPEFATINLYAGSTTDGGTIRLYTGTAYDTTIDYYQMYVTDDTFKIRSSTGVNIVDFDPTTSEHLRFNYSATGYMAIGDAGQEFTMVLSGSQILEMYDDGGLWLGTGGSKNGTLNLYGDGAASIQGGEIQINTADDHDTTIARYSIQAIEDDLWIGPFTDEDSMKYDGGLNKWQVDGQNLARNTVHEYGSDTTSVDGDIVIVDSTTATTVKLEESNNALIVVKSATDQTITIEGVSGNIDGSASVQLTSQWQSKTFVCDGTDWFIIADV